MQETFGFELFLAQTGQHPPSAKMLKGFGNGIVELVENYDSDTYRAVYTVRFDRAIYVLRCFKKKSKPGIKTPQSDIELICSASVTRKPIIQPTKMRSASHEN